MDIRAIALDLDGTTLNAQSRLSPGNREALVYALSRGIHVIVASGRAFFTLPQEIVDIPGIRYAVCSNGAAVCRVPDGAVLMSRVLPAGSAERILAISRAPLVTYEAFVAGAAYADAAYIRTPEVWGAYGPSVDYLQATRRPVENIEEFIRENRNRLDSVDVICWDPEKTELLRQRFVRELPEVYLTSSSSHRLEFSHPHSGKCAGVSWVLDRLGLSFSQLAAFGDGDNDAALLSAAGCGIAVANATPQCLAAADFVTKHNDADGIAHAMDHILKL